MTHESVIFCFKLVDDITSWFSFCLCSDRITKIPLSPWWSPISDIPRHPLHLSFQRPSTSSLRWDEPFTESGYGDYMYFQSDTRWAPPMLSSTLDAQQQELNKLSRRQTVTYHVHVTSGRLSCSLWFILPTRGMAMTLWGMLQLNNPPEEALTAVFSLVANKAVAVKPRLAHTLNAPRSRCERTEKDSSAVISEEMRFLNSINE